MATFSLRKCINPCIKSNQNGRSKSILGLLDVIKSDFEKTITDTESDEDAAQAAYEQFKSDAQKSIDDKSDLKGTKEGDKTTAELDITQAEADLKAETTNLNNELEELEKLKPVCVESSEGSNAELDQII